MGRKLLVLAVRVDDGLLDQRVQFGRCSASPQPAPYRGGRPDLAAVLTKSRTEPAVPTSPIQCVVLSAGADLLGEGQEVLMSG